jgi:hypothetical protein
MSSNRLTIVCAADIENEAGKEKKRMGCKKQEEKKKRIELNVIRMNSQYITKKRRKSMIDRMRVCLLHYAFSNILKKKKEENDKILISTLFLLYI